MSSPRRRFLGTLFALPALPLTAAPPSAAQAPSTAPAPGGGLSEGLVAAARSRYRLSAEEAAEVKKAIDDGLKAADRLRAFPLVNADEPVLTFEARPAALAPGRRS